MHKKQLWRTCYLNYFHEFLFAFNIALIAKLEGNQKPNKFFSFLESGQMSLQQRINAFFSLHPHSSFGGNIAFIIYALAWALCLFLFLRIFSRTHLLQRFLNSLAGFSALLALPASWLYVTRLLGQFPILHRPPQVLLFVELLAATISAAMYLYGKWSLPAWESLVLLVAHFVFWDAVCFGPYFWRAPFQSIFAIAGFCSALAWGRYVSMQRGANRLIR